MRPFNLLSSSGICSELGGRIKRARLAKNLSQQQLADMTKNSLSSMRRLEAKGQGSLEFIVRVAQALQAVEPLEDLFVQPVQSIAQVQREQSLAQRRRARLPKRATKTTA